MYIDSLFIYIYVTISDIFGLVKLKVGNFDFNIFTFFERIMNSTLDKCEIDKLCNVLPGTSSVCFLCFPIK